MSDSEPASWWDRAVQSGASLRVPPEWRRNLRAAERTLRKADKALSTLYRAREGSYADRILAAAALGGQLIDYLAPEVTPHEVMVELGYTRLGSGVGPFLCSLVQGATGIQEEIVIHDDSEDASTRLVFWSVAGHPRGVGAVYDRDSLVQGPYVLGDDMVMLRKVVHTAAWATSRNLILTAQRVPSGREQNVRRSAAFSRTRADFNLAPLGAAGVYLGHPQAQWYANRLAAYQGEHRTIRLMGPSGVGKSTLARILARGMVGEDACTLKVTASALRGMAMTDVIDLAEFLTPDVFLLDDLETRGENEDHLAFFETLHARVPLTVLTYMCEYEASARSDRESGYRPGRIDETFWLNIPPKTVRLTLLYYFLGGCVVDGHWVASTCSIGCGSCAVCVRAREKYEITPAVMIDIAERTNGMTGAYLRELIGRLQRFGIKTYKSEINKIKGEVQRPRRSGLRARPRRHHRRQFMTPEGYPNLKRGGMTVIEMRQWLLVAGLSDKGKRVDLVARIEVKVKEIVAAAAQRAQAPPVSETAPQASDTTEPTPETPRNDT